MLMENLVNVCLFLVVTGRKSLKPVVGIKGTTCKNGMTLKLTKTHEF